MGSGRASTNMLSSSYVTLTCAAIGWNKHTSNTKKYEVRTSLYGLIKQTSILPVKFWWMTIVMEVKTITFSDVTSHES